MMSPSTLFIFCSLRVPSLDIRLEHFELIFIHLLHLVHQPNFNQSCEDLCDIAKCVPKLQSGIVITNAMINSILKSLPHLITLVKTH